MSSVNERLSKSKAEWSEGRFNEGKAAGDAWAKDSAEYHQLANLKEFDSSDYEHDHLRDGAWDQAYALFGENYADRHQFGREVLADTNADDHYVAGFIVGAQEYFESVEDEL